jgi:hypothetical protein
MERALRLDAPAMEVASIRPPPSPPQRRPMSPRQPPASVTMPARPTGHLWPRQALDALAEHCTNPPTHRGAAWALGIRGEG